MGKITARLEKDPFGRGTYLSTDPTAKGLDHGQVNLDDDKVVAWGRFINDEDTVFFVVVAQRGDDILVDPMISYSRAQFAKEYAMVCRLVVEGEPIEGIENVQ